MGVAVPLSRKHQATPRRRVLLVRPSPQEAQALLEETPGDFRGAALQVPLTILRPLKGILEISKGAGPQAPLMALPLQQRDTPNLAETLLAQPRFPVSMGLEPA